MKKKLFIPLLLVVTVLCLVLLTSCGGKGDGKDKVMNLSLNPEVEFILDGENKVLYVNALNDEGNAVIANVEFKGKTAEEAATLFVEFCHSNGFDKAADGSCELEVEISGESVDAIFKSVKKETEKKISSLNAEITVKLDEAITKEELAELVEECMKELEEAEINALTEEQLLALLKESRSETEGLQSQELKEFYYSDRAFAIKQAEIEAYISLVEDNPLASIILSTVNTQVELIAETYEQFRTQYKEAFLAESSAYHQKMTELINSKQELLAGYLEGQSQEQLDALDASFASAKAALDAAKEAAESTMLLIDSQLQLAMDQALSAVKTVVEEVCSMAPAEITAAISANVGTAKSGFKAEFNAENQSYTVSYWADFSVGAAS